MNCLIYINVFFNITANFVCNAMYCVIETVVCI